MNKKEFRNLLQSSSNYCVEFSRNYLFNPLDGRIHYLVKPNSSYDRNPLKGDEEIYPEDSLKDGEEYISMNEDEVVEYFWRNGKVPEWIDVSPKKESNGVVYLELMACGRYTANEDAMYYTRNGNGPFGIKGPILPKGWISLEESGKFWL
jgi:hypothetical protein